MNVSQSPSIDRVAIAAEQLVDQDDVDGVEHGSTVEAETRVAAAERTKLESISSNLQSGLARSDIGRGRRMTMADQVQSADPRSPGITYQQLLDTDNFPVPEVLRLESPRYLGSDDVPKMRYTSAEWHEREVERLWKQVWQFACREEQIAARRQLRAVRDRQHVVHRHPRRPRRDQGVLQRLPAPRPRPEGPRRSLLGVPLPVPRLDLGARRRSAGRSRRAGTSSTSIATSSPSPRRKVDTWGGFVFINPDPEAGPLADFLGEIVAKHFERWKLEDRYIQGHVQKVLRCNWKIAQEAFCESYHAPTTHPQTAGYLGDVNSQIDIWDNFARVITPGGTPSPLLNGWIPTEDEILRYMLDIRDDEESYILLGDGQTAREVSAAAARERWRPVVGEHGRRVERLRVPRQHRLHRVPQLPSVGGVQPDRVPVPSERQQPPRSRSWT